MIVHPLNWLEVSSEDELALDFVRSANPDCVLAADLVYDPFLVPHLVRTLRTVLAKQDKQGTKSIPYALVSSTIRNPDTYRLFLRNLRDQGLHYSIVEPEQYSSSSAWGLPLFPSVHDKELDGRVEILTIQAVPFGL